MRRLVLFLALAACASEPHLSSDPSSVDPTCFHPANYVDSSRGQYGLVEWSSNSALPAVDSGASILAAINDATLYGGKVCRLPAGQFLIKRAPANTYNGRAGLSAHGYGIVIEGQGIEETTLVFDQDAEARALKGIQFDPGCDHCAVKNLTIDGTRLRNTDAGEQTIAIDVGGNNCPQQPCSTPVLDTVIENVRFFWAGAQGERWGDCIRVGGNTAASQVRNTRIRNVEGVSCGRSFIAWQRNANALDIAEFYVNGDGVRGTVLDGEASGGEGDTGTNIGPGFIWFDRLRTPADDSYVIAGTSQTNFNVHDVQIVGGRAAITCVRCKRSIIKGNILDAENSLTSLANIDLANLAEQADVSSNQIRRRGGTGPCIRSMPHAGVSANLLNIVDNTCINDTEGASIMAVAPRASKIEGNLLQGNGGPNSIGIYVSPVTGGDHIRGLAVNDNVIVNMTYSAVRLSGVGNLGFSGTIVDGNVSTSSGPMRCDNSQYSPPGGIKLGDNNWSTPAACVLQ
jgi:hypothetical protein